MAYGHAERNLTLIRQLEAETRKLLGSLSQLDPEQSAWLQEATGPRKKAPGSATGKVSGVAPGHQHRWPSASPAPSSST
jgi:hypothetical protein